MTGTTIGAISGEREHGSQRGAVDSILIVRLCIVAAVLVSLQRIWLGWGLPLWLDETWTAMIATQPTWAAFWREAWLDCNAPLYYVVERLWVSVAGDSNLALRLPSALSYYAAAIVPLVWRDHGLSRRTALLWATLILLWSPATMIVLDARAYGLLMLESVLAIIAFARAWRRGGLASFALWALLASLQMLTHYFAGFVVAAQGLALLWRWRWALVRRWPAFAPLALPVAWTLHHLPRLHDYARPDVVWYEPTGFDTFANYATFTLTGFNPLFAMIVIAGLAVALRKSGWRLDPPAAVLAAPSEALADQGARIAFIAGGLALVAILAATAVVSSLTDRYLVPVVPAMLLGVVLIAARIPRADLAIPFLVAAYAAFALNPPSYAKELRSRTQYGYELPSAFLAASRPTRLVFVWDHPAAKILDRGSLAQIGEFFLHRAGLPVATQALVLTERDDPNAAIRAAATAPNTAVLWLYNARRRSAARLFAPTLADQPGWRCRDERRFIKDKHNRSVLEVGTIACLTPATKDHSR